MSQTPPSYDIEILGFPTVGRDQAIADLAKAFRIERERATRLVDKAPVVVKANAARAEAERYLRALLLIGADVRLASRGQQRIYRAAEVGSAAELSWDGEDDLVAHAAGSGRIDAGVLKRSRDGSATPAGGGWSKTPSGAQTPARAPDGRRTQCPRCGFDQPASDACVRCGIIFSKYKPATGDADADRAAVLKPSRLTPPPLARVEAVSARFRGIAPSRYTVSSEDDDDGLFMSARSGLDPGRILREAAALSGVTEPVGRSVSGAFAATGSVLRQATGEAADRRRGSADVGFWDKLGGAARYGVRGAASQWLLLLAVLGAFSYLMLWLMNRAPVFTVQIGCIFGLVILFSAFLAAQWRFFHAAFGSAVAARDDEPPPVFGLEDFKSEFVLPGEFLCLAAAVLWAPLIGVVVDAAEHGRMPSQGLVVLLSLLPLVYWPMGMAYVSASGRLSEIFIVTAIFKGIAIGGLEYAFIAVIGVAVFFGMNLLTAAVGEVTVWTWALLYAALGYASAVQGYLIGRLLRRRPHMIEGTVVED